MKADRDELIDIQISDAFSLINLIQSNGIDLRFPFATAFRMYLMEQPKTDNHYSRTVSDYPRTETRYIAENNINFH